MDLSYGEEYERLRAEVIGERGLGLPRDAAANQSAGRN